MCLSLMYWYLRSMYLGTMGDFFFQTCVFLVLSIPLCVSHFPSTVRTNSNTPVYFGMTACALATSSRTICHRIPPIDAVTSTSTLVNQRPLPPRTIKFIHQPHSSSHHWIDTSAMDTDVPPTEVTFPAGGDSPLRHSSLISAAAFADVVALTTSPAAAAASASTIVLEVSQSFLLSPHRIYSMNSHFCQWYEFIP